MWVLIVFKNDNNELIKDMQYNFYAYCISTMFNWEKKLITEQRQSLLFYNNLELVKLREIDSFDHRLIQECHDKLAAVFRYDVAHGKYEKKLFEISNDEIREFFNREYIDTEFLDKLDEEYWYLNKHWYDFIIEEMNQNYDMVRELVKANLICKNNTDKWEYAYNAANIVKEKYNHIPWILK